MTPFKKNLQRFLIFFFSAVSIGIIVIGINRTKKVSMVTEVPTPTPKTPTENTPTTVANSTSVLSFVGKTYQTPYGNASVEIKVKENAIIDVTMPEIPNSPPSLYAKSFLIDQALKAGSANIQGVSGATYTSLAFKASLESAIAQAKTQGKDITPATPSTTTSAPASTAKPSVPRQYRGDDDDFRFDD